MKIEKLKAGSTITAEVRDALAGQQLPQKPHFVIRTNLEGSLSLTALSVDTSQLLPQPVVSAIGALMVPIGRPVSAGQRLGWSVFVTYNVPMMAAYLIIGGKLHYLTRKADLAAGAMWSSDVILEDRHID